MTEAKSFLSHPYCVLNHFCMAGLAAAFRRCVAYLLVIPVWSIRKAILLDGIKVTSMPVSPGIVSLDVQSLHPGEFVPLFLGILVAANVFPGESEREPSFDLDDLVDHVVF